MMENREYLNNLFDIYADLLTTIEKDTFISYYMEDLSLSEIAENRQVTKSNVGKTLNNVETKLKTYETKLKIYTTKKQLEALLNNDDLTTIKHKLTNILKEL